MKTILVTGSTDGIGLRTAADLAAREHRVVVHGRSEERCAEAQRDIARRVPEAELQSLVADFSALAAVRRMADEIRTRVPELSVLLLNAGVYLRHFALSADGYGMTYAVNHLAPFLLTNLVLDVLAANAPSRIVVVSSVAHTRGRLGAGKRDDPEGYSSYGAYAESKLANVLFTYALARRLPSGVTANCLHPGVIGTKLLHAGFAMTGGSLERGAATSVYLADSPDVEGRSGGYYENRRPQRSAPITYDEAVQERLWEESAALTGLISTAI